MGLRARLAIATYGTVTFVFAAQFIYPQLPWQWPYYYPCYTDIDGMPCRIVRKIPIDNLVQYGIVLATSTLLLPLLVWWVLVPVRRMLPTISQVGPQNLGHRIRPGRGRDEIKQLGRALDTMMNGIAAGYEGQRKFAANASHELRTPLALQRTLIEVGMAEPLTPEQSALLASQLLETNARNERLIEGLLVLSQADQGLAIRTPQRLDIIAAAVIDAHTAPGITVKSELHPYVVPGDGVLLERLVRNLVHNATKYNHPGGAVIVSVGAALTVENTGPVVAAEDVTRLFEPFTRLSTDRIDHSGGSGLGLAIARSIVQAHDGTITAVPRDGGGLRVTVRLPRSP
ncbi:sensor histidine kinase [Paractinoplanes brasiliensis]|uniref:histidine kinase n=1 Tax=Paractinoplanes brasiliensis TaxID=52695 RepID=A0A4R6JBL6_9ACTN|nr:HAMP domain-containing sensor histidine kinase [Actinoplanes brasiliensis]TDO33124.1 signal transduction histidine kinase [Actinoplanes brasiliensis]GID28842.1 two-component sensor histidine kinase [Actinoplanes brasiliensis]